MSSGTDKAENPGARQLISDVRARLAAATDDVATWIIGGVDEGHEGKADLIAHAPSDLSALADALEGSLARVTEAEELLRRIDRAIATGTAFHSMIGTFLNQSMAPASEPTSSAPVVMQPAIGTARAALGIDDEPCVFEAVESEERDRRFDVRHGLYAWCRVHGFDCPTIAAHPALDATPPPADD